MTQTYKQTENPNQEELIARAFDLLFEEAMKIKNINEN